MLANAGRGTDRVKKKKKRIQKSFKHREGEKNEWKTKGMQPVRTTTREKNKNKRLNRTHDDANITILHTGE